MTATLFDYSLAILLLFLAWRMLGLKDLFVCIVLYIAFGLVMALTWVALNAPDIALVEAAVGSGVVGSLFLGVLGRLESHPEKRNFYTIAPKFLRRWQTYCLSFIILTLIVTLSLAVYHLPKISYGLQPNIQKVISLGGAKNWVTAVILNFRAYDTLLELAILFLVVVALDALLFKESKVITPELPAISPILTVLLHLLVPLMIVVSAFLLWIGADNPGGAFQAGSLFAGAGILLYLGQSPFTLDLKNPWVRLLMGLGFAVFIGVGIMGMGSENVFLEYPQGYVKEIILIIEILATGSIGLILIALFAGCTGFLKGNK